MISATVTRLWNARHSSRLARLLVGSLGAQTTGMVLLLLINILLARLLGPEHFGVYAFVYAVVSLLAIPVSSGLPTLVVRLVAAGEAKREWGPVRGLFERAAYFVFGIALIVAITGFIVINIYSEEIGSTRTATFMVGFVLLPLLGLGAVRAAALRGMRRVVMGLVPETVIRPMLFLMLLLFVASWSGSMTATTAMGLYACAAFIAFVAGFIMLYRALPGEALSAVPVYHTRYWLSTLIPLSILAGVGIVNAQAGLITLGLLGTDADVGIFRVAERGATLALFAFNAVNFAISPYISRFHTLGDVRRLRTVTAISALAGTVTALLLTSTLLLFGEAVIDNILGAGFNGAYSALAIISIGYLISAMMGPVTILLNMTGHERQTAIGMSIAAGLNVLMNIVLVPTYGVDGAAIAMAISTVTWSAFLCWKVHTELRINPTITSIKALRYALT